MKEKKGKCERAMLVLLFTLAATALLAGTVTAVTHTEVESVTRYAPASPAADEEFEVTLRISYAKLPLVVGIVETIPEGFKFPSSDVSTTPYKDSGQKISFAAIDEKEIKYKVIAPSSGEGTFTGEWVDLLVLSPELEEGKERWHTVAPEGGTLVEIGGGGAGAKEEEVTVTSTPTPYVPAVTKASRSFPVMEAGKEVATTFKDMDVSMIALKADKNVNDVKVEVERIERTPDIPAPSGVAYTYLDMNVENTGGAKIEGKIEFKVAKSWLANNNIDEATVKLNRYDENEGWEALPSMKVREDNDFVFFEAPTPGFSTFAVTGEAKEEVEAAAATPTPAATAASATAATPGPTIPSASESEVPGFGANPPALYLILVVFFALVAVALIAGYVFGKRGKGGSKEG